MADYSVRYNELDTLLQGLEENTKDTPYEIEISSVDSIGFFNGSSTAQSGTLQYILQQNPTKFVSLTWDNESLLALTNVYIADRMFSGCSSLVGVDIPAMPNAVQAHSMFYGCTSLTAIDITGMTSLRYAQEMFLGCTSLISANIAGLTHLSSFIGLFEDCSSLTSVDVSGLTAVTNASRMFYNCSSLVSVDVSGMTGVTDASRMFHGCSSLTSVDVSGLTAVTNASRMFYNCSSLTSVDVSGMTGVTDASSMFYGCSSLTSVDVSGMTGVTNAKELFSYCSSLVSVDVSGMTGVTDASSMFHNCRKLGEIHNWQIPLTAIMTNSFSGCKALAHIYTSKAPREDVSWHVWDIRKDTANSRSTVRVYSEDGSYVSANVPSGDSWSMEITGKTDELYFSAGSSITQEHMQKMLATRVPVTSKSGALDPAKDNFVLMAKDPASFKTNFVTDTVAAGNSVPVSSQGVAAMVSETEAALGAAIAQVILSIYPVGSIYMSMTYFDPGTVFGGSWERLPDGVFIRNAGGDAGAVGNVQGEGLPNITGETFGMLDHPSFHCWIGALRNDDRTNSLDVSQYRPGYVKGNLFYADYFNRIKFNASWSNGIYGASAHVTPYNYCVYMWRRIS